MSAPGGQDPSHAVRLRFENIATWIAAGAIALLIIVCFVGILIPTAAGEVILARAVQAKDAVVELLGVLGGYLGMSWGRGHMDKRIDGGG